MLNIVNNSLCYVHLEYKSHKNGISKKAKIKNKGVVGSRPHVPWATMGLTEGRSLITE